MSESFWQEGYHYEAWGFFDKPTPPAAHAGVRWGGGGGGEYSARLVEKTPPGFFRQRKPWKTGKLLKKPQFMSAVLFDWDAGQTKPVENKRQMRGDWLVLSRGRSKINMDCVKTYLQSAHAHGHAHTHTHTVCGSPGVCSLHRGCLVMVKSCFLIIGVITLGYW